MLHSAIYALAIVSVVAFGDGDAADVDFNSLEGVVTLFRVRGVMLRLNSTNPLTRLSIVLSKKNKDPNTVFAGWIHYLCYDVSDSLLRFCILRHVAELSSCKTGARGTVGGHGLDRAGRVHDGARVRHRPVPVLLPDAGEFGKWNAMICLHC